ncbi:MAG: hypothetical protein OEY22_10910 [Candidatus Bathyarchaeota archaeon]|nr:hypothetical protein [Candidatus Bathyarchaeota archaeon]MDH5787588.1 hypothetical protein [Candidatus Bathyarchaeota archaeon]
MPQVTCPNCGLTISLENRREIDSDLIKQATRREPKTFTELLHITRLSRKTLSLRLKALCENGVIVKKEGAYRLNGKSEFDKHDRGFTREMSRLVHDRRVRTGLMMITFLLFSSASGYVLGAFLIPSVTHREPVILGHFTMALDFSSGVEDLYAWQVAVTFNPSEVKLLEIESSGLIGDDFPFFNNATTDSEGSAMFGGTLLGPVSGKNGPGRLATVTFGYYVNEYTTPKIVGEIGRYKTLLLTSDGSSVPIEIPNALTFAIVP